MTDLDPGLVFRRWW